MKLLQRYVALLAVIAFSATAGDTLTDSMRTAQTIALGSVTGAIGPLALDEAGGMLFAAALDNNSVEVIDLKRGAVVRSLSGVTKPAGLLYVPGRHRLYVSTGDGIEAIDPATGNHDTRIEAGAGAGYLGYDANSRRLYAGVAGALISIDLASGKKLGEVKLDGDPAQFQLEASGPRIFVNVPSKDAVVVIDRAKMQASPAIPVAWGKENGAMALDEKDHRLMVATGKPAKVLVLDTGSMQWITEVVLSDQMGDLFYDAAGREVFGLCGTAKVPGLAGVVFSMSQRGPDHYKLFQETVTGAAAHSGVWSAGRKLLFVGVPGGKDHGPQIIALEAKPI